MNFLAHLYLSPNNPNILLGNFMADDVKGSKLNVFKEDIKKGIVLHRAIDGYTDNHPIVKQSKNRLHSRYRLYKGIIIDIFYDYFLAKNWKDYSAIPLEIYVQSLYQLFQNKRDNLPYKTQQMLPLMIRQNWLYNYKHKEGIQRVLTGMNRRTQNKSQMHLALEDLEKHYQDFNSDFKLFFKELQEFTHQKLQEV